MKWNHKSDVFDLLNINNFSFTLYNKFDETYQFFSYKKAYKVKRQDFFQKFFENCIYYGLDTKP